MEIAARSDLGSMSVLSDASTLWPKFAHMLEDLIMPGKASIQGERLKTHPGPPACEAVRKLLIDWIGAVRPSRSRFARRLRMRSFFNVINRLSDAEERLKGVSQSTHGLAAALFPQGRPIA